MINGRLWVQILFFKVDRSPSEVVNCSSMTEKRGTAIVRIARESPSHPRSSF